MFVGRALTKHFVSWQLVHLCTSNEEIEILLMDVVCAPFVGAARFATHVHVGWFLCMRVRRRSHQPSSLTLRGRRVSSASVHLLCAMGSRRARGTSAGRGAGKGRAPPPTGRATVISRPDPGDRFPKFALAPYATATGSPFYLPQQLDEKRLLSLKNIAESRGPRNSEAACLRLGIALSEAAGVAEMGAEALQYHAEHKLGELGLDDLVTFVRSEAGQKYIAAAQILNKANNAVESETAVETAVDDWLGALESLMEQERAVRKLAQVSARLYLWSMDTLEQLALVKYPAAVLADVDPDHPAREVKAVNACVENPKRSTLRAALIASYTKTILGKQQATRKRSLVASSPEDAPGSEQSTDSSAPPKAHKKKDKSKKDKAKKDKKHKDKKHKKKQSKDKRDKKRKTDKQASSSDSTGATSGGGKKEKKQPTRPAVSLSSEEPPSPPAEPDYAVWGAANIRSFALTVADAVQARGKAKTDPSRLTLAALVSVLDNIPTDVLAAHGLTQALAALKTLTRLPKAEKLDDICGRLEEIVAAATPFAPAETEPVEAAPPEGAAKTAAE